MAELTGAWSLIWDKALPVAKFLGAIAAGVGASSLLIALFQSLFFYGRDLRYMNRAMRSDDLLPLPKHGPLHGTLGTIVSSGEIETTLSPDSAWEFIRTRLESRLESLQAPSRFFAYVPLLIGLSGTLLALAEILPRALDESTALALIGGQLEGVFVATLLGVIGSLLGGAGGVVLSWVSGYTHARAEAYIHEKILPRIPERRIPVEIDQDMFLEEISKRAETVVKDFREALMPLANGLEETARQSTLSAEKATGAFVQAAAAVKEAGSLEGAARIISETASSLSSAVTQLTDGLKAAGALADTQSDSIGTIRDCLDTVGKSADRMSEAGDGLSQDAKNTRETLDKYAQATDQLNDRIETMAAAFTGLATRVEERNTIETDRIEAANDWIKRTADAIEGFSALPDRLLQELGGLRSVLERHDKEVMDGIHSSIEGEMKRVTADLLSALEQIQNAVPLAEARLRETVKLVEGEIEDRQLGLGPIRTEMVGVREELAKFTGALRDYVQLTKELGEFKPPFDGGNGSNASGVADSALIDRLENLVEREDKILSLLTEDMSRARRFPDRRR